MAGEQTQPVAGVDTTSTRDGTVSPANVLDLEPLPEDGQDLEAVSAQPFSFIYKANRSQRTLAQPAETVYTREHPTNSPENYNWPSPIEVNRIGAPPRSDQALSPALSSMAGHIKAAVTTM